MYVSKCSRVIVVMVTTIAFACKSYAQDTLALKGPWQIQPATSPGEIPAAGNWGTTMGPDAKAGNMPWSNINRDSVNNIWYQKAINIPAAWKGKRVVVNFRRIEGDAIIFLNNKRMAELLRPGGEINLTAGIHYGKENVLRVFVTRAYTGISRNFQQDPIRFRVRQSTGNVMPMSRWGMSISAPVTIIARGDQAITDVFCISSYRKKELTLQVEIDARKACTGCRVEAVVTDVQNKPVLHITSNSLDIKLGKAVYHLTQSWPDAICWELEKPYLYKAQVQITGKGKTVSRYNNITFGFRELWTEGNQLFMNGHLSRWRLTDLYGVNKNGLSFYRLMGYNVGQVQPHSNLWWRDMAESYIPDEDMLNAMDSMGMGVTMPAPSVSVLREQLLSNEQMRADYTKEVNYYIRHYRNHPCIMAWVIAMNSSNPKLNIWPWGMGKRDTMPSTQGRVINLACSIVKQTDPTRLTFSHADGSVGDVSSANVYLNFAPLQEREEWPVEWARHGNMPYSAIEFGPPYWNNFWKGNQFLLTEYLSMYLGDSAYTTEGEKGLRQTMEAGLHVGSKTWEETDFSQYPGFWTFQKLFTHNTNRSWRTWGINAGYLYWLLEGYGDPPGPKRRFTDRYKHFKEPLNERPSWASPRFDIFKDGNQPLLAYIAGYSTHTDKTHTFFANEIIHKQVTVVWDGATARTLVADWTLQQNGSVIQKGQAHMQVNGGAIAFAPVTFTAPTVLQRTDFQLLLSMKDGHSIVATDTLSITIFPNLKQLPATLRVAVYDPVGKSTAWLKQSGCTVLPWQKGQAADVLVIGREALHTNDSLPYTEQDVANGLQVIILEQKPEVWEGMGFKTIETMPRYTFIRDASSPLLKGLQPADLINWRGSPDLLPEAKWARSYDSDHAPKWTNTHAVASVAIKTPELAGFTPVLQTEFDMAYTPLLEWRYGKGKVTFCSLDLTGRVGVDPAATLVAMNLLETATQPVLPTRKIYYTGDTNGRQLLNKLGVQIESGVPSANSILIMGSGERSIAIDRFVNKGGIVFHLPQTADELTAQGFKTTAKALVQVTMPAQVQLLRAIGPNLLRWRDALSVTAFTTGNQPAGCTTYCNGLVLEKPSGKGKHIFIQISPSLLETRYADAPDRKESIQLSVLRLYQLMAQLLTNTGATASPAVAQRLTRITAPPTYQTLGTWKVLGPFAATSADGAQVIATPYPGEQDAITGAENPNNTYKRTDGGILDWRKTVQADANGFIDFKKALGEKDELAVAYVTRSITSAVKQEVVLRFGVDFWMEAWLNGKSIMKVIKPHPKRENEFVAHVPLVKGENTLTLKVASGRGGFGFWANIGYPVSAFKNNGAAEEPVSLYIPLFKYFDPYQFAYW